MRKNRWAAQLAPSPELRRWFNHEPSRYDEFRSRYGKELEEQADIVRQLIANAGEKQITLLYAARDTDCNQAVVLRDCSRNCDRI